jgi:hypothetical protein
MDNDNKRFCECGCGKIIKKDKKFVHGHNKSMLGKKHSEETKLKISKKKKGCTPWHKGKKDVYSKEVLKQMSDSHKGKMIGEDNHFYNKKHSEETKSKISLSNKGKTPWNKGKKLSKEHREKLIINSIKRMKKVGANGYCKDFDKELKDFIRERDSYECQDCNMGQDKHFEKWNCKLSVHHKDGDKLNTEHGNLISLCKSCHTKADYNLTLEILVR